MTILPTVLGETGRPLTPNGYRYCDIIRSDEDLRIIREVWLNPGALASDLVVAEDHAQAITALARVRDRIKLLCKAGVLVGVAKHPYAGSPRQYYLFNVAPVTGEQSEE